LADISRQAKASKTPRNSETLAELDKSGIRAVTENSTGDCLPDANQNIPIPIICATGIKVPVLPPIALLNPVSFIPPSVKNIPVDLRIMMTESSKILSSES
jgi:hypothetical protein